MNYRKYKQEHKPNISTYIFWVVLATLILLKLFHFLDWSWWWVLSPIWILLIIMVVIIVFLIVVNKIINNMHLDDDEKRE